MLKRLRTIYWRYKGDIKHLGLLKGILRATFRTKAQKQWDKAVKEYHKKYG